MGRGCHRCRHLTRPLSPGIPTLSPLGAGGDPVAWHLSPEATYRSDLPSPPPAAPPCSVLSIPPLPPRPCAHEAGILRGPARTPTSARSRRGHRAVRTGHPAPGREEAAGRELRAEGRGRPACGTLVITGLECRGDCQGQEGGLWGCLQAKGQRSQLALH